MFLSNRLMHLRYLLLVAVCVAVPALSQNICRISHREGFSNCSILSLAQDADGYVWAGSCDGLNLWDGHYARNFRLSGNLVQEIVATDDGYLWVRTNYGVDRVDARARTAELHADFPRVYQYTARSRDEAFFLYKGRLYGYVASESRFEPLCGVDADDVLRICLDPDGVLWFVRRDGMDCAPVVYDAEGRAVLGAWKHIPVRNGISFVRYDGDRTVYFVDGAGRLCRFDTERQLTSAICGLAQELERRGELAAVIRDGDDYVLAFEMGGVLRLHASGSESGGYTLREIDVACGVFSLLKDWNQDIVWIGTDGSGLLRQSAGDIAVRSITYDMLPYKLTKPIKALFVDERGNLWVGTKNDGILCIRDFHAQRAFGRENTRNFIAENTALRKNSVYAFAASRRGVLWIGGDGGVCYYSYGDGRIHALAGCEQLANVHGLHEDAAGVLWAATIGSGVYRIELAGHAGAPVARLAESVDLGSRERSRNFFFSFCEESDSTLWFCNHGIGAVRYHKYARRGEVIPLDGRRGLAANDVTVAVRCSDGTLWFGTGCGMGCYRPGEGAVAVEFAHDQLQTGVIHGLLADSLDNVWAATNAGIVRYNPAAHRSVAYGASYGLEVVEFSDGAYFYDRRAGKLLFGGINGLVVVSGGESLHRGYMPPVRFRDVTIDGTDHSISKLMRKGKLVLTHRQGAFGLSIVALDYINGGNYSYLYNLEGFDSQWNDNRHNNRLLFANLPPGNYSLNVRYRNNMTGELSPVGRLAIRVLPPPYASAWAWVVYGTAACVFVAFTGRYLERRRRERMHRRQALYDQHSKELLYESRIRSFASLTNELSVPLTLINGSCQQILECGASDGFVLRQVGFIHRNALKLKDLTCLLNELRAAGAADRPDDVELLDVTRMCNGLVQTFAEYAETHKVGYRTEVGEGMLFPSARGTLSMVLNIVLSNAFRRSETGGEVFFGVSVVQDRLRVVVSNRGEGVDLGQIEFLSDRYRLLDYLESRGKGGLSQKGDMELAICHNLAAKLGGEFRIASEGDVTTVTLSFPELEIARVTQPVLQVDMASDRQFGMPGAPAVSAVTSRDALPTMLVVCEDPDMASFLAQLFAGAYDLKVMGELGQAAEQLAALRPQVVICSAVTLDPAMTGVIRHIRRSRHMAQVPVILLTSASRSGMKIEGLESEVDICLAFPFDIAHLRNVVGQLLRRYESLKDYGRSAYSAFDLAQGHLLHKEDKVFLDRMLEIIHGNILDTSLSTQFIADRMGMSLPNFYRRLGGVTDRTPACIIREYRLGLAEQLLVTTRLSIDEIIYKSGFSNRSTFFRRFVLRFGCTPKVYREQKVSEAMETDAGPGTEAGVEAETT